MQLLLKMARCFSLGLLVFASLGAQGQGGEVTVSGVVQESVGALEMPYVNIVVKRPDGTFVTGTVTGENGRFSLTGIKPGDYILELSFVGYKTLMQPMHVGKLSQYLDLGILALAENVTTLQDVVVTGRQDEVAQALDKKVFTMADNINQGGGSLLQAMQNLPGVTVSDDGTVLLRGSNKVAVLIDGKQTALTGFGAQRALDNIPASAIDRIEVVNNPTARYDANGTAGIINIIYKKEVDEGFNGKAGLSTGLGALWIKRGNLPTIRPQYRFTPKVNPSLSINYRKKKVNLFLQGDNLYTQTLNKNEFVDRYYENGDTIRQQSKRNRDTNIATAKGGLDWFVDDVNTITISSLFSSEDIKDHGDEPFFNGDLSTRLRLWQFLEDEVKTTVTESAAWQHKFPQPGRVLHIGLNYTFHREDEKYFFTNIMPTYTGLDSFKLISDEHVGDFTVDYVQPLRHGRVEGGLKFRNRYIPTNMVFVPGLNSPLDVGAGGWANYRETIPALYGNYVFEGSRFDVEAGLRMEYVKIAYNVNPNHNTYKSDGYDYLRPFPNVRLAYKPDEMNVLSLFFNQRVDRPNEVDIRIFPKYDDPGIIKVGNPGLRPQFARSIELGYKHNWGEGYLYASLYRKDVTATITRIASTVPGSNLIYNIFQNAGNSHSQGLEVIVSNSIGKWATFNLNLNGYKNTIGAFSVVNKYPEENTFSAGKQEILSGNLKLTGLFHLPGRWDVQFTALYQAPDAIPQGKVYSRFSIDAGVRKWVQKDKGELFVNVTDLANGLRLKKRVVGEGFTYVGTDYNETQVVRMGYTYKF